MDKKEAQSKINEFLIDGLDKFSQEQKVFEFAGMKWFCKKETNLTYHFNKGTTEEIKVVFNEKGKGFNFYATKSLLPTEFLKKLGQDHIDENVDQMIFTIGWSPDSCIKLEAEKNLINLIKTQDNFNINRRKIIGEYLKMKGYDNITHSGSFDLSNFGSIIAENNSEPNDGVIFSFEYDENEKITSNFENAISALLTLYASLYKIKKKIWEKIADYNDEELNNLFMKKGSNPAPQKTTDDAKPLLNMNKNVKLYPLNTILYGPPGTGKTYNTINKALEIVLGADEFAKLKGVRTEINKKFKKLTLFDSNRKIKPEGRIAFTTFHQSFSYEDFVEGIKPNLNDDDESKEKLSYHIADGIFKTISNIASRNINTIEGSNFEESYDKLINKIKADGGTLEFETRIQNRPFTVKLNKNNNLIVQSVNGKSSESSLSKKVVKAYLEEGIINDWPSYTPVIGDYLKSALGFELTTASNKDKTNKYVLIIDEINRGNISQIFGELITLIEDSKRKKVTDTNKNPESESLEVILPYSKEAFSVPDNLYIIGTMNTADRSVEALDTALRRRFSFEEMLPQPEILKNIQGIDLVAVLKTINDRLEYLKDRDHTIGHAFFINCETLQDIADAFHNKIVPLLQEYFYNDYSQIQLVLGSGFVEKKDIDIDKIFKAGNVNNSAKDKFTIKKIDAGKIASAIKTLLEVGKTNENE